MIEFGLGLGALAVLVVFESDVDGRNAIQSLFPAAAAFAQTETIATSTQLV